MPTYDSSDLLVPAFDANGQTISLVVDFHPSLFRMLDYVVSFDQFPFGTRDAAIRWCTIWGFHSLFTAAPTIKELEAAKMLIQQEERFQLQKDCLAISVEKRLRSGDGQSAARLVKLAMDDYSTIPNEYFRALWMSTLAIPMELLRQHGIAFQPISKRGAGSSSNYCGKQSD